MTGDALVMELIGEQGPGRESQVQPPAAAWKDYFRIDTRNPPTLRLTNRRRRNSRPETRPIVVHGTPNWTIEIEGARVARPAIIRFRRSGKNRYDYWVHRPPDAAYLHCRWLLENFRNPHRIIKRRWLII